LNNFKADNDVYGYSHGAQMILALANLLSESSQSSGFIGHIGGDDFISLVSGADTRAEHVCKEILGRFAKIAPSFYSEEHQRACGHPGGAKSASSKRARK